MHTSHKQYNTPTPVPPREDAQRKDRVRTKAGTDPSLLQPSAPDERDKGSRTVPTSKRFRGAKRTAQMNATHGTFGRPARWNHGRDKAEDITYWPRSFVRHNDIHTHKPRKDRNRTETDTVPVVPQPHAHNERDSGSGTVFTPTQFMGAKSITQASAKHGTLCRTASWNGGRGKSDAITYRS
eukprot:3221862-Pleurochrysis_carterae.AAC.1